MAAQKNQSDRELLELILNRVNTTENAVKETKEELSEALHGVKFIEEEFEDMRYKLKCCEERMEQMENGFIHKFTEMGNRSRRNNIILHGIEEGSESEYAGCEHFVENFIQSTMGRRVEIEEAYRINQFIASTDSGTRPPRVILARCLRLSDREYILTDGRKLLKDYRQTNGRKVFLTDDIEPCTREEDKKLRAKAKQFREAGYVAIIPFTTPRILRYKNKNVPRAKWETYRGNSIPRLTATQSDDVSWPTTAGSSNTLPKHTGTPPAQSYVTPFQAY